MDTLELLLRLGLAFGTAAVLGFERESHGRAAGLRTLILVCMAAAVTGILSEAYYQQSGVVDGTAPGGWRPDPARLGAGLFAGMGFLGAGAIVRQGPFVRGVTTAALLWFITVLGLCYGSGEYRLGLAGTAVAALAIFALPKVEAWISNDRYATLEVRLNAQAPAVDAIVQSVEEEGVVVKSIALRHDVSERVRTVTMHLKFKHREPVALPDRVVERMARTPGVMSVSWS